MKIIYRVGDKDFDTHEEALEYENRKSVYIVTENYTHNNTIVFASLCKKLAQSYIKNANGTLTLGWSEPTHSLKEIKLD